MALFYFQSLLFCLHCSGLLAGVPAAPPHAFHGEHLPPTAELLRGAVCGEGSGHGNTHPQGERDLDLARDRLVFLFYAGQPPVAKYCGAAT